MPAKAGIQAFKLFRNSLDSRLRGNDSGILLIVYCIVFTKYNK